MRNLKRALSLALASVMVLGLMVVGTSASYSDVTSEQNQEAIEVLQTVGIMKGDDQGNFNPDAPVSRNEMAVVMANLMDYRVSTYAGTSPFTDVPEWAEPYVAACWTNGITSGYTATTYGGSDSVTTAQAALMLMKALGYFQYGSDFGDDWQLATVSQGNKIDLFDSVESGVREAMTRNDLAQLVLNTLESGMVEADNNVINVNAPGVSVEAGKVTYNYVTSAKSYAGAISKLTPTSSTSATTGWIVELGEKLYNGDLKKTENTTDDFGRPATKWAYKTESIGTYGQDLILSATAKVTLKTMYETLGSDNVKELSLKTTPLVSTDKNQLVVYVDGKQVTDTTVAACFDRNSSAGGNSGKGVLTQMFQDDENNVTLVFTNYYVAQATADYSASKGSVAVSVKTKPATGFSSFSTLSDDDFEAVKDIKDDDYILYTYAQGQVQDIVKAETVTGEVTAYSSASKSFGDASGSVTLDGTKYDYAKYAEVGTSYGCGVEYTVGVNAVIVVDANGYAYYVDDASASTGNYVYIDGVVKASGLGTTVIADAYFADGTNEEITLKKVNSTNAEDLTGVNTTDNGSESHGVYGWFSYSKNSAGKYTLKSATTSAPVTVGAGYVEKVENGRVTLGSFKLNDKTVFVVKDKNDDITVYTGVSNVPDIKLGTGAKVVGMKDKDDSSKAASLVFIDAGSNGTVKNASKDTLIYVLKLDNTSIDNTDNEKVYTYKVVINGEQDTIKAKELWTVGAMYEDYTIDSDGYYEAGDRFDVTDEDQTIQTIALGEITQSGNVLTLGGSNSSLVVNDETHIALIMRKDPTASGNTTMRNEIMDDKNADFEVEAITAKNLADKFDGWKVNGRAYVVYNDLSKSDLTVAVYVDVTGVAQGTTSVAAKDTADQNTVEQKVSGVVTTLTTGDAPKIGEGKKVTSLEYDEVTRTFTATATEAITDTGIGSALASELSSIAAKIAEVKVGINTATTDLGAAIEQIKTAVNANVPAAGQSKTVTVNVAVTMKSNASEGETVVKGNTMTYKLVVNFAVPAAPAP